jgi:hypothetical protein
MNVRDRVSDFRRTPAPEIHQPVRRVHPPMQSDDPRDLLVEHGFTGTVLARKLFGRFATNGG